MVLNRIKILHGIRWHNMKNLPEDITVGYIYTIKRGPVLKRLRVKINGLTVCCGNAIRDRYFSLVYIDRTSIKIRCDVTGQVFHYENISFMGDF